MWDSDADMSAKAVEPLFCNKCGKPFLCIGRATNKCPEVMSCSCQKCCYSNTYVCQDYKPKKQTFIFR